MKKYWLILFALLIFISCARISSPTGGPIDETPPLLIRTVPDSAQINYSGNTILLEFDEWVKTNNIENNLIITPKIDGTYKARANKTSVLLTFDRPFADSTTYTFNFGNTIQDITNSNAPLGLKLSFSTGPYIDSLEVSGNILDLYTQEPKENTLVSLYALNDTLDILTGQASYFTRTDTSGNYKFTNLPSNDYLVYAAIDKNNNLKAESEDEAYGFYTDTIRLTQNISDINFTTQRLNTRPLRLTSSRPYGKYFDLTFSKPITEFSIESSDSLFYIQKEPNLLRFFNHNQAYGDSSILYVTSRDSINNILQDTITYYFIDSKIKADPFNLQITPRENTITSESPLKFNFSKPIKTIDLDSILIQVDSTTYTITSDTLLFWNENKTQLTWPIKLENYIQTDQSLTLNVRRGSFISAESDTNDVLTKRITAASLQDTGLISGVVSTNAEHYIIQLLNPNDLSVIQEIRDTPSYTFSYLDAGSYLVRFIEDINGNGSWDTGNILTKTPPEPIKYYYDTFNRTKTIKIKKNWELSDINITYTVDHND